MAALTHGRCAELQCPVSVRDCRACTGEPSACALRLVREDCVWRICMLARPPRLQRRRRINTNGVEAPQGLSAGCLYWASTLMQIQGPARRWCKEQQQPVQPYIIRIQSGKHDDSESHGVAMAVIARRVPGVRQSDLVRAADRRHEPQSGKSGRDVIQTCACWTDRTATGRGGDILITLFESTNTSQQSV